MGLHGDDGVGALKVDDSDEMLKGNGVHNHDAVALLLKLSIWRFLLLLSRVIAARKTRWYDSPIQSSVIIIFSLPSHALLLP